MADRAEPLRHRGMGPALFLMPLTSIQESTFFGWGEGSQGGWDLHFQPVSLRRSRRREPIAPISVESLPPGTGLPQAARRPISGTHRALACAARARWGDGSGGHGQPDHVADLWNAFQGSVARTVSNRQAAGARGFPRIGSAFRLFHQAETESALMARMAYRAFRIRLT